MNYYGNKLEVYRIPKESTINPLKSLKNLYFAIINKIGSKYFRLKLKVQERYKKYLISSKRRLVNFIRKYYDKDFKYIDPLLKKWKKNSVTISIDILVNGFVLYLLIAAFLFVIPSSSNFLFLGSRIWHIPISIIYLGIISYFLSKINWRRKK